MVFEFLLPRLNPKTFEQQKMTCLNCENPISMRITKEYTSELCLGDPYGTHPPCGIILWYPPRADGSRNYGVRKFISRETYLKNKDKDQERNKFITDMHARGIGVNHVVNESKIHRMLTHEHPIESGVKQLEENKDFKERVKEEIEKIEEGLPYAKR